MGNKRVILLVVIMTSISLMIGSLAISVLYEAAFTEQRLRLTELAKTQARLIESVAIFDRKFSQNDHPDGAAAATISQIQSAFEHSNKLGATGEFTLAHKEGNNIVFELSQRHLFQNKLVKSVAFNDIRAEPMRLALSGKSGTVIGPDYRGEIVLAAYEPVNVINLGIVAKIDLSEIRAPFIRAGTIVAVIASGLIACGVALFFYITNPIIRKIQNSEERVKEQLAATAEANEVLVEFAYAVSHDLKAPLRAIHNYAEFLQDDLLDTLDDEQEGYLNGLFKATDEADRLINDLLDYSRISAKGDKVEQVDVVSFLKDISKSELVIDNVALDLVLPKLGAETKMILLASPILLKQVTLNLISNAIKYNTHAEKNVVLGCQIIGNEFCEIFVKDNGIGIDEKYLDKIFEIFHRLHAKDEYEGTGIGLAIVKKSLFRMNGTIRVESTLGVGSQFYVRIPLMKYGA